MVLACLAASFAALPAAAIASPPTLPVISGVTVSHAELVNAESLADQWWAQYAGAINAMLHGASGAGTCTDYASARRPDIIARVEKTVVLAHILRNQTGPVLVNWVAKNWVYDAWSAGLAIGRTPRPGAVIVFQPGAYGAYAAGHVAVVDRVNRNGSFTISEEHAPQLGVVTSRRFRARTARAMTRDPRIAFIY